MLAQRTYSGRILGFGDPIIDLVSSVSSETLESLDMQPGGCIAIDKPELDRLLSLEHMVNQDTLITVPGGSACNVCKCLAGLRGQKSEDSSVAFVGVIGRDTAGEKFKTMLESVGVTPILQQCESEEACTASCICFVDKDSGERTMRTYLGAAQELTSMDQLAASLKDEHLPGTGLVHFEGYSFYKLAVTEDLMRSAKAAGAVVSIDLASFELVTNCWDALLHVLHSKLIDIIFCNEDEAKAVNDKIYKNDTKELGSEKPFMDDVLTFLVKFCQLAVMTRGKEGCIVGTADGQRIYAPAEPGIQVVDTIGAGDHFSAGFLHAWILNAPLDVCARCGCVAGAKAVQSAGSDIGVAGMENLRNKINDIIEKGMMRGDGA